MKKIEIIRRLCTLTTLVGDKKFNHQIPHDCFCDEIHIDNRFFRFDEEIIKFIENAVKDKLDEN